MKLWYIFRGVEFLGSVRERTRKKAEIAYALWDRMTPTVLHADSSRQYGQNLALARLKKNRTLLIVNNPEPRPMKEQYLELSMRKDTLDLITRINALIDSYVAQGFMLSVRQLYYQLVARAIVENTEKSYKRVAKVINDARLAGLMDWDAIEDRGRDIVGKQRWLSGADIVDAAASSYHMDMWENQNNRVFVIVEKAALVGVLGGVCEEYDVPLLAARGFPSVSIVREMALTHLAPGADARQGVTVIHLGDHDPSGLDMTRDLRERFELFIGEDRLEWFTLDRVALNMKQIEELKPPPNPAKTTDSRYVGYKRKFGVESWELDALEPSYMVALVKRNITRQIDTDAWAERTAEVAAIRKRLTATAVRFRKQRI